MIRKNEDSSLAGTSLVRASLFVLFEINSDRRRDLVFPVRSRNEMPVDRMTVIFVAKIDKESFQKSKVKTMLIAFYDKDGIIHKEFVSEGQTVNA